VTAVDASDHTPYYPDEIREVPLMDDRLASLYTNLHISIINIQFFVQRHGLFHILLSGPQISESILISCGVDNKFVLLQNVLLDQVPREYYKTYLKQIFVP
jgi:hypothetical protein